MDSIRVGQLGALDARPEVAELAQRRGVERPRLDPAGAERAQPPAHLAGRPGRERDRQHLGGGVDPARDAVRDPVRDRPGLAGAGAGQHPDRAAERLGDLALLGVEGGEEVGHLREHLLGRDGWIRWTIHTLDVGGDSPR